MQFKKFMVILVVLMSVIGFSMIISPSGLNNSPGANVTANNYNPASTGKLYPVQNTTAKGFSYYGKVPGNTELHFVVYVPLKNQSILNSLANQVSTPGTPLFGKTMTYSQIEKEFMNTNTYNNDLKTLENDGFKILSKTNPIISAEGTEFQISHFLGLNTNYYSNGTATYYYGFGTPTLLNSEIMVNNISSIVMAHPTTLIGEKQISSLSKIAQKQNQTLPLVGYSPKYLESVYNATTMYKEGYNGSGQTIGILDFGGDPYIKAQLSYYDREFNISAPPHFNIVPIGPYQPVCGLISGWAGEISLDVESSHTMAPGANITLYIGNLDCDLTPLISFIDSQNRVNDLSQSFSLPESFLTSSGAYYTCEQVTNEMYAMGSLEGITFSASSGDVGASGFSTGPLGTVGYPATSPYVTSVGGTTTYLDFNGTLLSSFYQTAWSNYGFVPPEINYGGSTGGISYTQPIMPYQNSSIIPKGFPYGKTVPDLSFEASIFPGFLYVMPGNVTGITGGTSEASPILAGLITLADEEIGHKIGMIEPSLYYLGGHDYKNVFIPVNLGYNIPFTDHYGYNLVNGWGSLNISAFAQAYKTMESLKELSILVGSSYMNKANMNLSINETELSEYQPGQSVLVFADINSSSVIKNMTDYSNNVVTGSFYVSLITLSGNITTTQMTYNTTSQEWTAEVTIPDNVSGPSYFEVYGHNGTKYGMNVDNIFIGDFLNIIEPAAAEPFSTNAPGGLTIVAEMSYLNGTLVQGHNATISMYSYSIMNNTYYMVYTTELYAINTTTGLYAKNATCLIGNIPASLKLPDTVSLIKGVGSYAYLPFMNGPYLQDSVILGPNVVEPGAVGAGQYIYIEGSVAGPDNEFSPFADLCSNITFSLYSPANKMISSAEYNVLDDSCNPNAIPELYVPSNASSGLYTILINSSYFSHFNNEYINGSFYGQIYVTKSITPIISVNSVAYEGQNVTVMANIQYPNGTEVKYGMYSMTFYPALLDNEYYEMTEFTQIAMNYNSTVNEWVGHFKLPSTISDGSFGINYYGILREDTELPPGLYNIYISGISENAYPTTTAYSAQKSFEIEPYTIIQDSKISNLNLTYGLALKNDKISYNGNITDSILLGNNYINNSSISLSHTTIMGTLYVNNSVIYLNKTIGSNIVLKNSTLIMVSSYIDNINSVSSKLVLHDSSYKTISPAKPEINIISPVYNSTYTGNVTLNINITGNNIAYTDVYIDNHIIYNTTDKIIKFSYNTNILPEGTYNVTVKAMQNDGLTSYNYTALNVNNTLSNQYHNINSLKHSNAVVYDIAYVGVFLGALGSVLGILYVFRKRK